MIFNVVLILVIVMHIVWWAWHTYEEWVEKHHGCPIERKLFWLSDLRQTGDIDYLGTQRLPERQRLKYLPVFADVFRVKNEIVAIPRDYQMVTLMTLPSHAVSIIDEYEDSELLQEAV